MTTKTVNTHTGSNLDWTCYRYGDNTLVFQFQDSDGNPYDISGETFTLHIRNVGSSSDILTLTEADGLTKGGSQLTIDLSAEDISTDLKQGLYFLQMDWDNGTSNRALVQGKLRILDQENSGSSSSSATLSINTGDSVVEITVQGGGGEVTAEAIETALGYTPANSEGLVSKADIDSPAFTGTPTAPTPDASDNSTKISTTAFVKNAIAGISGTITDDEKKNITKLNYDPDDPLFSHILWQAFGVDAVLLDNTDTDAVIALIDKAGSGDTFSAADADSAPTLADGILEFDGTNDRLVHSNPSAMPRTSTGEVMAAVYLDPSASSYFTVFNIGKSGSTSVRRNYIHLQIDALGRPRIMFAQDATDFTDYILFSGDRHITPGFHVVNFVATGSEWKLYLDGIELPVVAGAGSNLGLWIGDLDHEDEVDTLSIAYRFNQYRAGKMSQMYFFTDVLSDEMRWNYVRFLRRRPEFKIDPFIGIKCVFYGDSITASGTWPKYVCDRLGMRNILRGIGGTKVKEDGQTAYVDAEGNTLTGNPPPGTPDVDYFEILASMSNQERIDTIPLDAKIIVILAGANDGGASGDITDPVGEALDTSFYAAYKTMLDRIFDRCPNALIILMTPPHHATGDNPLVPGTAYDSVRKAIREIGYLYSYPVIDLKAKAQINNNNYSMYLIDSVHPNEAGGRLIAAVVAQEIQVLRPFVV